MMTPNDLYKEFKYFKEIYTTLNKLPNMEIISKNGVISFRLSGGDDSDFFILRGELYGETEFLKWVKQKDGIIKLSTDDISTLGKCLKKNAKSVNGDDEDTFVFAMDGKDDNDNAIVSTVMLFRDPYAEDKKLSKIIPLLTSSETISINSFGKEILNIYLDGGKISMTNGKKLLEIPTKKVLSLIKGAPNCEISYSNPEAKEHYIAIKSSNSNLMLEQIFATI